MDKLGKIAVEYAQSFTASGLNEKKVRHNGVRIANRLEKMPNAALIWSLADPVVGLVDALAIQLCDALSRIWPR